MKVKTVIFDFDGTIADTLPKIFELYNKYADDFNLAKINRKEAAALRNKSAFKIIKTFGISIIKIPFIANKIRSELNSSVSDLKIFQGMKDVFKNIKKNGLQLGLLTTNSKENVDKFLESHRIDMFDFVHSEKNLLGKSNYLKKLIKNYNFDKDQTIYVGDEVRYIDACRDNGIKIISVTWGFNTKEILLKNKPDYLVNKPAEILKIMSTSSKY